MARMPSLPSPQLRSQIVRMTARCQLEGQLLWIHHQVIIAQAVPSEECIFHVVCLVRRELVVRDEEKRLSLGHRGIVTWKRRTTIPSRLSVN